jgi:hypothetical protein
MMRLEKNAPATIDDRRGGRAARLKRSRVRLELFETRDANTDLLPRVDQWYE